MSGAHDQWTKSWAGVAVAAAVLAYFSSGEMAFMDPVRLGGVGLALAVAIILLYDAVDIPESASKARYTIITAAVLFAATIYIPMAFEADRAIQANANRCRAIQRDMLSSHRRMTDGPEVFQALGCRPSGEGIIRVPPTDRERAAGRSLPDGGYPHR